MEYVVYLTIYKGNLLPPFYIGHCKKENIKKGYRGSVSSIKYKSIWKKELKDNFHLFDIKIISEYSSKKEAAEKETKLQKILSVHKNPLYINRSVTHELFFSDGKISEEMKIHLSNVCKKQYECEEFRKKHLQACKENNSNHSDKIWINNGFKDKRVKEEIFENTFKKNGWVKGRIFKNEKAFGHHLDKNGENNPFYGKKHSEKSKKIMSEKSKKHFEDEKQRKIASDNAIKQHSNKETRKNYLVSKIKYHEEKGHKTWKLKHQLMTLEKEL
jgi:hypothetical protein